MYRWSRSPPSTVVIELGYVFLTVLYLGRFWVAPSPPSPCSRIRPMVSATIYRRKHSVTSLKEAAQKVVYNPHDIVVSSFFYIVPIIFHSII